MWQTIADKFLERGIEIYPPAIQRGECKNAYCVLKDSGASPINGCSSQRQLFDLMCYVPQNKYTSLEPFVAKCKEVMDQDVYPLVLPTGLETPSFFDDTINAYMISVEYRANRRNKHV